MKEQRFTHLKEALDRFEPWWPWFIALLALSLRVAYFASSLENPFYYAPTLDEAHYIAQGKTIAAGQWLGNEWTFFMDPLYSYFLAGVFFLGGDIFSVRVLQILLDVFSCLLVLSIGTRLFGTAAGRLAALLYALFSSAIFYAPLLLKTTASTFVLLLFLHTFMIAVEQKTRRGFFLCGLLAALATYLRGNFVLLIPLAAVALVVFPQPGERRFTAVAALLAGSLLVFSAGGLRNYYYQGNWQFLVANTGYVMYSANNPQNPLGEHRPPAFVRSNHPLAIDADYRSEAARELGYLPDTNEASRYWFSRGLSYWMQDWLTLPGLVFQRGHRLVSNYEWPNNYDLAAMADFSPMGRWTMVNYALLFALGVPGLLLGVKNNRLSLVLWMPVVTIVATCLAFYTVSRLRFPMTPVLAIGAGFTVGQLLALASQDRKRRVLPLLGIVVGLFLLSVFLPVHKPDPASYRYRLAKAYLDSGQPDKSLEVLPDAVADPGLASEILLLRGNAHYLLEQCAKANAFYYQALRLRPRFDHALYNLSRCQAKLGNRDGFLQTVSQMQLVNSNDVGCLLQELQASHRPAEIEMARILAEHLPNSECLTHKGGSILVE